MHNAVSAAHLLTELKARSLQLSITTVAFRTPYSSGSCLYQGLIDILKCDRSCVSPMQASGKAELVAFIIASVHHLGMNVIAKGVITAAQLTRRRQSPCEDGQDYLFSKLLNPQAATMLLADIAA
jgi:EAL domain-containing protein (putative c-di-GMP-specific phosphodiesterase class I)